MTQIMTVCVALAATLVLASTLTAARALAIAHGHPVAAGDGRRQAKGEGEPAAPEADGSALVGAAIRGTARALGHGAGRISIDHGSHWHDKGEASYSEAPGGHGGAVTMAMPDGSRLTASIDSIVGRMEEHDREGVAAAREALAEIEEALPPTGEDGTLPGVTLGGCEWLQCLIALVDGDVTV